MEESEKNNGKLITANFKKAEPEVRENKPAFDSPEHTNPVKHKLFKLTHTELVKPKENYRSFSGFKPEDLR